MKTMKLLAAFFAALFLAIGCAGSPKAGADNSGLDTAMRKISDYLNERIPHGNKVVFLNVKSNWPDLSEYILSGLSENAVNDGVFSVVDRQQLDAIRAELNFQWSGEVSDASAQEIGKMLGAQTIVSGTVTTLGDEYRIQVRAIVVQTAAVQGQTTQMIDGKGKRIVALTKNTAPSGNTSGETSTAGGGKTQTGTTTAGGKQTVQPAASATIANGTYTFYPRPKAMREGRDINVYLDKIVVRGGYFNMYFVEGPVGDKWPSDMGWNSNENKGLIYNLDQPNRPPLISTGRDTDGWGKAQIYTFKNHNVRRFRFEQTETNESKYSPRVFEEINIDDAEYKP
jgi:TolB-like protein